MSPLIAAVIIAHRLTYAHFFSVIAAFAGVAVLVFMIDRFSSPDIGQGLVPAAIGDLLKNHRRLFWVLFIMTLCYVGSEAAPNAWLPMYLRETFPGGRPYRPNIILFLFWLAITLGRFVCAYILTITQKRILVLSVLAGGAALCLAGAPAAENRIQTEILFILTGFFYSGIFPIIVGYSEYLPNRCVGTFFILLIIAGAVGASLVAESVGLVADTLGFSWGMGIAAIICAVILPLIYLLSKIDAVKIKP
jgi:fucose permease